MQGSLREYEILSLIGLAPRKFYNWKHCYGEPWKLNYDQIKGNWLTQDEKDKIIDFYISHEGDGYRRCAYMMMDQNVAYAAPSTVYGVLSKAGKMRSRTLKISKKGTGFVQPTELHSHWHSDITNITVGQRVYFLISILDGYSRSIISWELRKSMKSSDVGIVFEKARERFPDARPRIITDNGKQYKCREFSDFIRRNDYSHVTTTPYYPQSNGKQERFHGTLKSECIKVKCIITKEDANNEIEKYITNYNNNRLHSAIGYVTPHDKMNGLEDEIFKERDAKLENRRRERKLQNAC